MRYGPGQTRPIQKSTLIPERGWEFRRSLLFSKDVIDAIWIEPGGTALTEFQTSCEVLMNAPDQRHAEIRAESLVVSNTRLSDTGQTSVKVPSPFGSHIAVLLTACRVRSWAACPSLCAVPRETDFWQSPGTRINGSRSDASIRVFASHD